jgi:hypothetical protein
MDDDIHEKKNHCMNPFMWFIMITSFEILSQNNIISLCTLMQWTLLRIHYLNSMFHSFISLYANAIKFASCTFILVIRSTKLPIHSCSCVLFHSKFAHLHHLIYFVPFSFIFLCCHWNQKNCEVYIILFYWFHEFLYLCLFSVVKFTKFTSPSALVSYIL